jgi:DNA repair protein RadD
VFTLRPYQQVGVDQLREAFRKGRRAPLYVLPTGGGKTAVFSFTAEQIRSRGKRAMILVHRQELLSQASKSLSRLGVAHGLINPKYAQQNLEPIQVASVQTLVRRLDRTPAPDLVIVDEAHHATAGSYLKVLQAYPRARILGVTATPVRTDGAGLDEIFDDLILGPSISELIRDGYLVTPTVYAPPIGIDLAGVRKQLGDYDRRELGNRIDKPKITGDCIEHYRRLSPGEPAIAFCVSVDHAEHVASEFRSAGIRAVRVDGAMDDSARKAAIEGLGNGTVDVLTSADLIGEGVDVPRCSVAILLRPTYSEALYLQQVGRALRPFSGKSRALVLDHVGNCMRHGLPDDDRSWSLDGARRTGPRDGSGPVVRVYQCKKCYFVYECGPETCPKCGLAQPSMPRQIGVIDGDLTQLTREQIRMLKEQKKLAARAARAQQGQTQTLDDLIKLAEERGYKNPRYWAKSVFKNRRRSKQ